MGPALSLVVHPTTHPKPYTARNSPVITCVDGTVLSIQASGQHLCTPQDNEGPYTHLEVGRISKDNAPQSWGPYQEKFDDGGWYESDIWIRIPVALVEECIYIHGGEQVAST